MLMYIIIFKIDLLVGDSFIYSLYNTIPYLYKKAKNPETFRYSYNVNDPKGQSVLLKRICHLMHYILPALDDHLS